MEVKCAYTKLVKLEKLIPNPLNDNDHKEEHVDLLAKVMEARGIRHPIIVSKRSGFIVAGHLRLLAAKALGIEKYPVDEQDFENEADEYAFLSSDNNVARYAEFNETKFVDNLQKLGIDLTDIDFGDFGLLDFSLPEIEVLEPGCDEDLVPEIKEDPISKRGDVWILGNHRILNGDSTLIDDVEKLMDGEKADMVFTDPPYNQSASCGGFLDKGRESRKKLRDSDNLNSFEPREFLQVLNSLNVPTNYIFCSKNLIKEYIGDFDGVNRNWNMLIMKKKNPIPQKNNTFLADVEYLFCSRLKGAYWDNNQPFEYYHRVRTINVKPSEFGHPTEKQIGYIEPYFKISSKVNDRVLDLFLGSGSTLIACEKTNRKCYGMELDPAYIMVILERYRKYTGKEPILESTGQTLSELEKEAAQ